MTRQVRFSRTAYARRAAELAEELEEWHQIYRTRAHACYPKDVSNRRLALLNARRNRLKSLVAQLQEVAIELTSM